MNAPPIEFDESFVEEAVFLIVKARGEFDDLGKAFHREREEFYRRDVPAKKRDNEFKGLYQKYFRLLGLQRIFENLIQGFPLLRPKDTVIFVKRVYERRQEESELYFQGRRKTVYFGLLARRVLDRFYLEAFLRHELLRVTDMLDPHFQYAPHPILSGKNEIENNAIRRRFRLLWDLYIDARLKKKGCAHSKSSLFAPPKYGGATLDSADRVLKTDPIQLPRALARGAPFDIPRKEFGKIFSYLPQAESRKIIFKMEECELLTQADLLSWAGDPRGLKTLSEGGLRCPLCGFISFLPFKDWPREAEPVIDEIKKDYPTWQPSQGSCPQCFDLYSWAQSECFPGQRPVRPV